MQRLAMSCQAFYNRLKFQCQGHFRTFFFLQKFLVKMNDQFCLKASQIPMRSSVVQEFKDRRTMGGNSF